jgi:hypothetical protein
MELLLLPTAATLLLLGAEFIDAVIAQARPPTVSQFGHFRGDNKRASASTSPSRALEAPYDRAA